MQDLLPIVEAPYTLEGAMVLHQYYSIDWAAWHKVEPARQRVLLEEAGETLADLFTRRERDEAGAAFRVLGHKADLCFMHLRHTPEELLGVEERICALGLRAHLVPRFSYLSVIELSAQGAYERQCKVLRQLSFEQGTPEWDQALEGAMEAEKDRLHDRLYPNLPTNRYHCFYAISKRQGETYNWYALPSNERASTMRGSVMRGHATLSRQANYKVTEVISASTGLDDHEWAVDLFAEDCVHFKKLIYEMRFNESISQYAEFGQFLIGVRTEPGRLLGDSPER